MPALEEQDQLSGGGGLVGGDTRHRWVGDVVPAHSNLAPNLRPRIPAPDPLTLTLTRTQPLTPSL